LSKLLAIKQQITQNSKPYLFYKDYRIFCLLQIAEGPLKLTNYIQGKVYIPPSNYHLIENIFSIYQKIVNVSHGKQKDKNDFIIFSIKQKYPYKFEKKN
jgi:hypothetical protein